MSENTAVTEVNTSEAEFIVDGFRYVAQQWQAAGSGSETAVMPVMALHGWLDNSASFEPLAPLLVKFLNAHVLAPDLAGHGLSDHRKGFSDYPIWSEAMALMAMADTMGWQQFALVGHSRGAMMAMMVAALFPERISQLILLDALIPPPTPSEQVVAKMQASMETMQKRIQRSASVFPDYDSAVFARTLSEVTKVELETAKLLAKRGLSENSQGFSWHADDKLWAFGSLSMSQEQVMAFVANITAPTQVLIANQGYKVILKDKPDFWALIKTVIADLDARVEYFDDGHYLHMEGSVTAVANSISRFIGEAESER